MAGLKVIERAMAVPTHINFHSLDETPLFRALLAAHTDGSPSAVSCRVRMTVFFEGQTCLERINKAASFCWRAGCWISSSSAATGRAEGTFPSRSKLWMSGVRMDVSEKDNKPEGTRALNVYGELRRLCGGSAHTAGARRMMPLDQLLVCRDG